jgi:hypothetical protein
MAQTIPPATNPSTPTPAALPPPALESEAGLATPLPPQLRDDQSATAGTRPLLLAGMKV